MKAKLSKIKIPGDVDYEDAFDINVEKPLSAEALAKGGHYPTDEEKAKLRANLANLNPEEA